MSEQRQRWVQRITGRNSTELYLLRIMLTPMTRWGQLYLHIFYKGDPDTDLHDHPWDFVTFPLRGYQEMVMDRAGGCTVEDVKPLRFHYRSCEYTHKVLPRDDRRKIVTLVWHGHYQRDWGFWTRLLRPTKRQQAARRGLYFPVPWRCYLGLAPRVDLSPWLWEFDRAMATDDVIGRHPETDTSIYLEHCLLTCGEQEFRMLSEARAEYRRRQQECNANGD